MGWGSTWNNNELRYSLRSFEKHLSGIGTLFIVADISGLPKWLNNFVHIICPDITNTPAINTCKKILKACNDKRVSKNFLLSNDDFFLLKDFEASTFPNYFRGDLLHNIQLDKNSTYQKSKIATAAILKRLGKQTRHFGVHCPMITNKLSFIKVISAFNIYNSVGYLTRSLYGNVLGLEAEEKKDCKLKIKLDGQELGEYVREKEFFSISDNSINRPLMEFFPALYPVKSRWEV